MVNKINPKSLPLFMGYRVCFGGSSTPYGTSLTWQAIPDGDTNESYYVMTSVANGIEQSTRTRHEWMLRFFNFVGYFDPALKRKSQWHSAEHRVIRLLEGKLPLDLENARNVTDISPRCGGDNALLSTPEDFQLLEVLEVGKRIRDQLEKFIETGELPVRASSLWQSKVARKTLDFPGSSFLLPLFVRRKLFEIAWNL